MQTRRCNAAAGFEINRKVITMKIGACYKLIPQNEQITLNPDRTLNFEKAEWDIGTYDLNAVEAAVKLVETNGGEVIAISVGNEQLNNTKLKKTILSKGPAKMYGVLCEDTSALDSYGTAMLLKKAVEDIGDLELVICGEGSVDMYAQQVGPMLGTLLGWNTINGVDAVEFKDGKLHVVRSLEDETEHLEVELPAVLSVTTSINKLRIPSMKDIISAGKKPSVVKTTAELGCEEVSGLEHVSTIAPEPKARSCELFEEVTEETLAAFCERIQSVL